MNSLNCHFKIKNEILCDPCTISDIILRVIRRKNYKCRSKNYIAQKCMYKICIIRSKNDLICVQ